MLKVAKYSAIDIEDLSCTMDWLYIVVGTRSEMLFVYQ